MRKIFWFIAIAAFSSRVAYGVKVSGLYQAEVSVASQARDARDQAMRDGFFQILVKLSGDSHIDENPLIKSSIRRAEYYVSDFNYLSETKDSSQYFLQINYESTDVNRLLKKANIKIWGDNRPLVLVWLVVTNTKHEPEIIGNEAAGYVYKIMLNESKKYGLPLIFPMMDMHEIEKVTPEDVTTISMNVLENAAIRYSPEAILIGEVREDVQVVRSKWELILKNTQWNWIINEKSIDDVIGTIIGEINQAFSSEKNA